MFRGEFSAIQTSRKASKKSSYFKSILLLSLLSSLSFALPEDKQQMVSLKSDHVEVDAQTRQGIYKGHVSFEQGSMHLQADEATTKFNDKNELTYAKAASEGTNRTHIWLKLKADKPEFHAYAKAIEYFPSQHLVRLTGNAEVKQGKALMTSSIIEYDTLTHHLYTKPNGKQKTQLLFHMDNNYEQAYR